MIALTGYSGFIGHHLLEVLAKQMKILLLGRKDLKGKSDFCTFNLNAAQETDIIEPLKKIKTVIHLAACVHVVNDPSLDPLSEFRAINTQGTLNLAKQAASAGVKRFIFISSIKVNGEHTYKDKPFGPEDTACPKDFYGVSKAEAEIQLKKLGQVTGMEIVIIRPPLVYGPGVKGNFASLLQLVSKGIPLPFGKVKDNHRSFVFVENLIDLIVTCIDHPNAANEIFLVSDDNDLSTFEMTRLLGKASGKSLIQLPIPLKVLNFFADITGKAAIVDRLCGSLQLDISKTKRLLNWNPPISIEEGFSKTVEYYFKNK